jgi:hypothetical protein
MRSREIRMVLLDVVTGLADDLEIADHRILHQLIVQACHFVHAPGVAHIALNGLGDVA